jgi:enolase-phosphatase E1
MRAENVRAILLDIEGTTTPIDFVYKVLFPYARLHLKEFLQLHLKDLGDNIAALKAEYRTDLENGTDLPEWHESSDNSLVESITRYVCWLMDLDRKSTGLKSLQGKIWEAGYMSGRLRSEVYPDVPPALRRWSLQQKQIYIYSSGSVLAQKLLFAHTMAGDLTQYISGYFDTTTGPKKIALSYQTIAEKIALPAREVLFLSDVTGELNAARDAGIQTTLCVRPGNVETESAGHPPVQTFEVVLP